MKEKENLVEDFDTQKEIEKSKEVKFVKPSYEEMPTSFVDFKIDETLEPLMKKMHGGVIPKKLKTMFWLESVKFDDNDYNYIQSLKPVRQEYENKDQYHNRLKLQKYLHKYRSEISSQYKDKSAVVGGDQEEK